MSIEQEKMIVESLSCLYPLQEFEEKAIDTVLNAIPHWTPVTERYPEENDYGPCYGYEDGAVWWRNDTGLMGLGWYYQSTDKWAYYDELDRCEKCVGNVVEWMPLPEPYKGVNT